MKPPVKLAVLGAGIIGRRHIEHVMAEPEAMLTAIVDPADSGRALAEKHDVRWFTDFKEMVAEDRPDGVIIATPNQMHVQHGLQAIAAGLPALIEKPIADDIAGGERLVAAAAKASVPILTGHHRRHNPMIQRAKAIIDEGRLGKIVTVHSFFWLMKPDEYFDVKWRREVGAGPVLLNLIHDIDVLRHLCGEVAEVQAFQSSAVRKYPVDETTTAILKFTSGALGTVNITDTAVAPWSWEQTAGENPAYPHTDQTCFYIGGTHGSLSIPRLELWSNPDKRSWFEPFNIEQIVAPPADPWRIQIQQFTRVIRGDEPPVVSGREGLMTLKVIEAIHIAARTGQAVKIG